MRDALTPSIKELTTSGDSATTRTRTADGSLPPSILRCRVTLEVAEDEMRENEGDRSAL